MMPISISPRCMKASETHHTGRACMKLKVPSTGSTTQRRSPASAAPPFAGPAVPLPAPDETSLRWEPYSSPRTLSPKRLPKRSMTRRSTARSASVAKSRSLLLSMAKDVAGPLRSATASAPASRASAWAAAKRATRWLSVRLFPIIVARAEKHPPPCPPPQGGRGFFEGYGLPPPPRRGRVGVGVFGRTECWQSSAARLLAFLRRLVAGTRRSDLGARGNLRHGDVPPGAAFAGREKRIGGDDDDAGARRRGSLGERRLEPCDAAHAAGECAEARRMGGEIDPGSGGEKIVEAGTTGRRLQALDAAEAAIIEQHDDELAAELDRGRDFRIHHQIGAVADQHDDLALGRSQLDAEPAGDLVAHAGIAVFDVIGARLADAPQFVQLAGQAAGGADD